MESITLENFQASQKPINSPRSLEACLRQGVDPAQLVPKPFVVPKGKPEVVAKTEHEHYERRRVGT